jgi:hypothetical protein
MIGHLSRGALAIGALMVAGCLGAGSGGPGGTTAAGGAAGSAGAGGAAGAEGGGGAGGATNELDLAGCAPDSGPFSLAIDNPYLPLSVGRVLTFQGKEDAGVVDLVISVLDQTEPVAGVATRVVEEHEEVDGEVVEISRNFFVQAPDGTVCYYGEDVDIYEGGKITSHEGAWRAGEGENLPGIMMPASPAVGMSYDQESAPGIAMDHADVVAMGEPVTVPAGKYQDSLRTVETTPLEPGELSKIYAKGVGLVIDGTVKLVSISGP